MKKIKFGFSLAELLIALAIVAVVATMGFSITKRGIERAYTLYWYTGFMGIYEAFSDAILNDYSLNNETNDSLETSDFIDHVVYILNAEIIDEPDIEGCRFDAPNGTIYRVKYEPNLEYTTEEPGATIYHKAVLIAMFPPQPREDKKGAFLCYLPDYNGGTLFPIDNVGGDSNIKLQDKIELLPTYIDDGSVGRVIKNDDNKYSYTPPTYDTYKRNYCKIYGEIVATQNDHDITYLSCQGIDERSSLGILRFADPRKAN